MIRLITILVIVKLFKCIAEVDTVVTSYIYGIYIYIYILSDVYVYALQPKVQNNALRSTITLKQKNR